jgi:hypothetical protein
MNSLARLKATIVLPIFITGDGDVLITQDTKAGRTAASSHIKDTFSGTRHPATVFPTRNLLAVGNPVPKKRPVARWKVFWRHGA